MLVEPEALPEVLAVAPMVLLVAGASVLAAVVLLLVVFVEPVFCATVAVP